MRFPRHPERLPIGPFYPLKLGDISVIFGLRVLQIIKILSDPPSYTVTTEKGSFLVGRAHELITQTKLRDLIAEHSGYYLRPMKAGDWASIAQGLLHIVEERESGVEATELGGLATWLENYLVARELRRMDTLMAIGTLMPFVHSNGKIYIGLDAFRKWVRDMQGEYVTRQEMSRLLMAHNAVAERLSAYNSTSKKQMMKRYWALPVGQYDHLIEDPQEDYPDEE